MRCAERVGILNCLSDDLLHDELQSNFMAAPQVTAVAWKGDDMHMAVGTSYGQFYSSFALLTPPKNFRRVPSI